MRGLGLAALVSLVSTLGCAPSCDPGATDRTPIGLHGTCTDTRIENAALLAVTADPADDGIVLTIDRCPGTTPSCICDLTVPNVGPDVASALGPEMPVVVERETMPAPFGQIGEFVLVTRSPGAGRSPIVFGAGHGWGFGAVQRVVTFGPGTVLCDARPCDYGGRGHLRVETSDGAVDLGAHETGRIGPLFARALSDVFNGNICSSGPGNADTASWAVWGP